MALTHNVSSKNDSQFHKRAIHTDNLPESFVNKSPSLMRIVLQKTRKGLICTVVWHWVQKLQTPFHHHCFDIHIIPGHYYDGLKFACMDFSSQQQKRRKAPCIQTYLFLSFLITQLSFPINVRVWYWSIAFSRQLLEAFFS